MGEDQNLTMNQSGHLFGLAQDQSGAQNQSGELDRQEQPDQLDQMPYMQHMTTILVILHLSVFVSGLVGNSLVCLSVYRNKSLQTVTNYYIVNLAVADFLVILICLPPTVYWDLTLTWNFGLIPCKLVLYLQVSLALFPLPVSFSLSLPLALNLSCSFGNYPLTASRLSHKRSSR